MSWSFGETRALTFKAARGSGLGWGHSEEAAHAVCWLEKRNLPGLGAFAEYLVWRADDERFSVAADPILVGTALMDDANLYEVEQLQVFQPLLLVSFMAAIANGQCFEVAWDGKRFLVSRSHASGDHPDDISFRQVSTVSIRPMPELEPVGETINRVSVPEEKCIQVLEQFAARTYAPATDASRSAGAGAGDDGND